MIERKNNKNTTFYLAIFLVVYMVIAGILLCFFSHKSWWNNWMVMAPNLYMILGALFCPMMKKNIDMNGAKQTWLLVYKGIKMALTILMAVLYILFVKESTKAFILIAAICYLIGLILETYSVLHYAKHKTA